MSLTSAYSSKSLNILIALGGIILGLGIISLVLIFYPLDALEQGTWYWLVMNILAMIGTPVGAVLFIIAIVMNSKGKKSAPVISASVKKNCPKGAYKNGQCTVPRK